jgi:hypothetical protein
MGKKVKKPVVNMGEIKRNLLKRDTGLDSRFTTKKVEMKPKKKEKYKINWIKTTDY